MSQGGSPLSNLLLQTYSLGGNPLDTHLTQSFSLFTVKLF